MTLLIGVVAGFLAVRLVWMALRPTFRQPAFARTNHRGRSVPTAAGLVIVIALVAVEAGRVLAGAVGVGAAGISAGRAGVLVAAAGFGLLGLFDDLAGSGEARGFRGHLSSLARGRLTTGGTKVVGGVAVAAVAVAVARPGRAGAGLGLLVDLAVVALAANLVNLFDRAPGRAGKVSLAAAVALGAATLLDARLAGVAVVAGAGAGLLVDDLHERLMLGDTGANVLGGVLGVGLVLTAGRPGRVVALVVLAALNLLSELVSFSRVIDAVPPLRALDRTGRPRPGGA